MAYMFKALEANEMWTSFNASRSAGRTQNGACLRSLQWLAHKQFGHLLAEEPQLACNMRAAATKAMGLPDLQAWEPRKEA